MLAKYLGGKLLPTLPPFERNAVGLAGFPMLANDRYGNCTCAALGHAYEVVEWRDGKGTQVQADEQAVEALYWSTSGQVVIMTLLGGAGTFFGPFVGAATYLVLADRLSIFFEYWPLVIGVIFMVFVLFLPQGIWGTLTARRVQR